MNSSSGLAVISGICKASSYVLRATASYYCKEITAEVKRLERLFELQNMVASLSSSSIADALVHTLRQMSYAQLNPGTEFVCMHLENAIKDLLSGMDPVDMLAKYDTMLYEIRGKL